MMGEKIREVLGLELKLAARESSRRCDQSAASALKKLAETTKHVDLTVLHAYAKLLDDIRNADTSSDALKAIRAGLVPDGVPADVKKPAPAPKVVRSG